MTEKYRPEIDGLRALAVVAVILNHMNKDMLPSGYLGVDVFFVISGYVITSSLESKPRTSFFDFIAGFYERRIRRLLPALAVFTLVTAFASCLVIPDSRAAVMTGLASLLGLSNVYLYRNAFDYFGASSTLNPFAHTWSLGVEEQFYFVFPLLLWFGSRTVKPALVVIGLGSLIGFAVIYPQNQPAAYFLMPTRFWELAVGCLAFYGSGPAKGTIVRIPPLGVIAALVAVFFIPYGEAVIVTAAAVFLTALAIYCLRPSTMAYRLLTLRPVRYIGFISYSLYLWHWGVLIIARSFVAIDWTIQVLLAVLMLALGAASYHCIEQPFRQGIKTRSAVFVAGAALIGMTGTLSWVAYLTTPPIVTRFHQLDFRNIMNGGGEWMDCGGAGLISTTVACLHKTETSAPYIFVLGDSHAHNLVPSVFSATSSTPYRVKWMANAFLSPSDDFWNLGNGYTTFVSALSKDDIIVYSHRAINPDDRDHANGMPVNESIARVQAHLGILRGLAERAKVVLVDDTPKPCSEHIFNLEVMRYPKRGCGIPIAQFLSYRKALTDVLQTFAKQNANVYYFDPAPHLCKTDMCWSVLDGKLLYADSHHFSRSNPEPLKNFFVSVLNEVSVVRAVPASKSRGPQ